MRVKKNRDTLEQSYSLYTEDNLTAVSKKLYKEVCYAFNKELAKLLIQEGVVWKLSNKLGYLGIKRRKMKFQVPKLDFGEYRKTGVKTYHLNTHSNEWYSFCHWQKKDCRIKGKSNYQFILSRDNKRNLAKLMQQEDGYKIYEIIN
jgi:hypothetical protein